MKNKYLYLAIYFLFTTVTIHTVYGQTRNMPAALTIRIYNYAPGIKLSPSSQAWLSRSFEWQDSLTAAYIIQSNPSAEALRYFQDSLTWISEPAFKKILSDKERDEFEKKVVAARTVPFPLYKNMIVPGAEMNSQFGTAIKSAQQIQLTDEQASELFSAAIELRQRLSFSKANPDSGFFNMAAFESAKMSKILSQDQYNVVLAVKNRKMSEVQAKYVWHDMETLHLTKPFNKDTSLKMITVYYLLKNHITDAYANDKKLQEKYLGSLRMPAELKALREAKVGEEIRLEKYAW